MRSGLAMKKIYGNKEEWIMVKIRTPFAIASAVITVIAIIANPEKMAALPWFAGVSTGILVTYVASRVEG